MAQNREAELEHPSSSSDEEEQVSSEEEQASESEHEEEDNTSPPINKNPSASKKSYTSYTPALRQPSSSDGTGSESDSDDDSDLPPAKVNPTIKPIATKPMEKRSRSKPTSPPPSAGVKRPVVESEASDLKKAKRKITTADEDMPVLKRPVVESEASDFKKAKMKIMTADEDMPVLKKSSGDDPKRQFFQRLWSEDDEIVILKGLMDYRGKKGTDPMADMNAFHDFIKKSLHVDVSKTQLSDKVRRLKKKYENNAVKEKKGKDLTLPKQHEQKTYELSKKVWGKEGNSSVSVTNGIEKKNQTIKASNVPKSERFSSPKKEVSNVKNQASKMDAETNVKNQVSKVDAETSVELYRSNRLNRGSVEAPFGVERVIMNQLDSIEGPKKTELDKKWKKLQHEEIELYLKRVKLIQEQTKLVLESFKSAQN